MSILINIGAFIIAIAVLVAIHEYGHFWVARKMGVKVLRYSIGFGRPLWKHTSPVDDTEYVVAAIPLGGYVKMLDEREGDVASAEVDQAFNRQTVGKRFAIVAAGPIFNFLFAIAAFALMYMVGVSGLKPIIGEVVPDSPAAMAGLQPEMQIQTVNGAMVESWEVTAFTLIDQALETGEIQLETVTAGGRVRQHTLDLSDTSKLLDGGDSDLFTTVGMKPWRPEIPVIFGKILKGSAKDAGIISGDKILSADGQSFANWSEWVQFVRASPEKNITLEILREGVPVTIALRPASNTTDDGKVIGKIGAAPEVKEELYEGKTSIVRHNPVKAVLKGIDETWTKSVLIVRVLWKIVTGEASMKNISGPVTIAEFAGVSATYGLTSFLGFLALISISLGVMNLLPVPVLDGGHLFFYIIEWIKGSPVSETTEAIGQRIGLAMLGALMVLAFYNDFVRLANS